MKKNKREELKNRILDHKINDKNPLEKHLANQEANKAKLNAYFSISALSLGTLLALIGGAFLAFAWPFGIVLAVPMFGSSMYCGYVAGKQLKETKEYGKRYGLSLRETFKSFADKEVFETMAANTIDFSGKNTTIVSDYKQKQPIYSLSDEKIFGKQTTKNNQKQTTKEESQVEDNFTL